MNLILFKSKTKMFCFLAITLLTIYEVFSYSFFIYFMKNNDAYYRAITFYFVFLILLTFFILSTWDIFKSEPGYLNTIENLDEEEESKIIDKTYRVIKKKNFFKNLINKKKSNWWRKKLGKDEIKDNLDKNMSKRDFAYYSSLTLRGLEQELENCYVENSNKRLYCFKCKIIKKERSYHCKTCQKCVGRLDHHCYIIGQCVGENNIQYFIRFTFFCFLVTFVICIDLLLFYYFFNSVRQYSSPLIDKMFFVLLLTSLFICFFSGMIFFNTLRNISRNITGIEDRNLYFEYRNPFSKGWKKNFQIVFDDLDIQSILLPSILKKIK